MSWQPLKIFYSTITRELAILIESIYETKFRTVPLYYSLRNTSCFCEPILDSSKIKVYWFLRDVLIEEEFGKVFQISIWIILWGQILPWFSRKMPVFFLFHIIINKTGFLLNQDTRCPNMQFCFYTPEFFSDLTL